jgi:Sodium:neurotransmitter symporter family
MPGGKKNQPKDTVGGHVNSGYYYEGYVPYDAEDSTAAAAAAGDAGQRRLYALHANDIVDNGRPPDYPGYIAFESEDDYAGEQRRRSSRGGDLYPHLPEQYNDHGGDDGGGGGVDDRWRSAYPYVPTSYSANNNNTTTLPSGRRKVSESIALEKKAADLPPDKDGGESLPEHEGREQWGSQWEFIFSCIGLSVGIGNVWRFPTLAYENGGGSFLIPYFIILLVIGKPMYYMELALGQFVQQGVVGVWKICPLGYGVGVCQVLIEKKSHLLSGLRRCWRLSGIIEKSCICCPGYGGVGVCQV